FRFLLILSFKKNKNITTLITCGVCLNWVFIAALDTVLVENDANGSIYFFTSICVLVALFIAKDYYHSFFFSLFSLLWIIFLCHHSPLKKCMRNMYRFFLIIIDYDYFITHYI
ncbi:hypothetical protein V8G54_025405, partial [Vigna mungo]